MAGAPEDSMPPSASSPSSHSSCSGSERRARPGCGGSDESRARKPSEPTDGGKNQVAAQTPASSSPGMEGSAAPSGVSCSSSPFGRLPSSLSFASQDSVGADCFLKPDQQQHFLLQGRLVDDTISPRPPRSLFSLVSGAGTASSFPHASAAVAGVYVDSSGALHSPDGALTADSCRGAAETAGSPRQEQSGSSSLFFSSRIGAFGSLSAAPTAGAGRSLGLSRSVEKIIESGDVKMADIEPERAADISKALLLHRQHHILLQSENIQRTPLTVHPLSPCWKVPSTGVSTSREPRETERSGDPARAAERGTRTLNIIREVYEEHHPPSLPEETRISAGQEGDTETQETRKTTPEDKTTEGGSGVGEAPTRQKDAKGGATLAGPHGEERALVSGHSRADRHGNVAVPSELKEEEEARLLDEIEERLTQDAEGYLEGAKLELDDLRISAEREVLALQYIPFKADRLLTLPTSCRESLLGVFVCLCLQHIESLSPELQSLVAEWSLIFLHTLASPQVLNVDASVEKSLVRPIILRDQLLKDGLQTSDIVSPAPLVKAVVEACEAMQPEVNSIFNTLHSEMSCFAHQGSPQDSSTGASRSPVPGSPFSMRTAMHAAPRLGSPPSFASQQTEGASVDTQRRPKRQFVSSPPTAPHAQYARERQGIVDVSDEEESTPPREAGRHRGDEVQAGAPGHSSGCTYTSGGRGSGASAGPSGVETGDERRREGAETPQRDGEGTQTSSEEKGPVTSEQRQSLLVAERKKEELHARRRRYSAEEDERSGRFRALAEDERQRQAAYRGGRLDGRERERSERGESHEEKGRTDAGQDGEPPLPSERFSSQDKREETPFTPSSCADLQGVVFTAIAAHPLSDASLASPSSRSRDLHTSCLRVCLEKKDEDEEDSLVVAVGSVERESHEGSGESLPSEQEQLLLDPDCMRSNTFPRYNFPYPCREKRRGTDRPFTRWESRHGGDDAYFAAADEDGASALLPSSPPSARTVLLRELTTALVTSGSFDARVQFMLQLFAVDLMRLNPLVLIRLEHHLAADLLDLLRASTKEGARQKTWRRLKIAGAAIGGGFLVALTAGLAAPGIVAGIASLGVGGASVSAFLASAGGMAAIVSLFGAGGAGLTGWKYSRRIANIKVFEFDMLNGKTPSSLGVTVCVSGYLRTFDDISLPWIQACPHACSDLLSLKWEPTILKALGGMVVQMLSQAVGQRPVSLVGYSMGARVIFYCLQTLWKRRKLHVVCDCVLIGLPASLNTKQWAAARDVVSRRLVNVYSRADWLLAFLYRWMEWGLQVAGLGPVKNVQGVENYDVTGLVKSHAQYPEKMPDILTFIGFDS
ncbi:hypothetical protein NCLIV_021650 [Neospora caninum Liverpool]|uniref:Transmembrane protein n=1 Tax=Neospora caninum (strain Liverpool) TaxID=572307 RepID=F0VF83_NEOCL|nr:hypothetical protein NCLIV_021650 [Neospora caninum Liverpool]CBZ52377.1 hypothetical protein NCLIV_021650 [Neospora caninum Liverpool]|eukprot:XP_003882409.1 hypothetical protein NCLIV_021650 [Neospora caninum Liverpool]